MDKHFIALCRAEENLSFSLAASEAVKIDSLPNQKFNQILVSARLRAGFDEGGQGSLLVILPDSHWVFAPALLALVYRSPAYRK